jgi:hypothetical protein
MMHHLVLLLLWFANGAQTAPAPALVSVARIWDGGAHNAFTDLIRWRDRWYCTFREGDDHVGGDGRIRVLVSEDGDKWTSSALIGETGIDLRDPKLSITPDDRLMIVAGGSVYEGKRYIGRQPRVMFSSDGGKWSTPQHVQPGSGKDAAHPFDRGPQRPVQRAERFLDAATTEHDEHDEDRQRYRQHREVTITAAGGAHMRVP